MKKVYGNIIVVSAVIGFLSMVAFLTYGLLSMYARNDISYAPPDMIEEHYNRICVYWDKPKRKYCEWTNKEGE